MIGPVGTDETPVPETLISKIILVKGSVPDTSAALDSRIYFDQNGVLSQRFGLTAVPARITPAPREND